MIILATEKYWKASARWLSGYVVATFFWNALANHEKSVARNVAIRPPFI